MRILTENVKKGINIVIGGGAILITLGIISYQEIVLALGSNYTIGITEGYTPTASLGEVVDYYYFVNGIKYNSNAPSSNFKVKRKGGRYLVKFSTYDPDITRMKWDKPIPDFIEASPPEGWNEIPSVIK